MFEPAWLHPVMPGMMRATPRSAGKVVAVAVTLGVVVAAARILWLPRFRPHLHPGERVGVDVSAHQGAIDWPRVARDRISFAYIKATEGADLADLRFVANWSQSAAAGLQRGAYHFFTLCTTGRGQADNFIHAVPHDAGQLPPALDLELAGNCADRPPAAAVEREVRAFVDAVEARFGQTMLLYVGADFERRYDAGQRLGRPAWRRRLLRRPAGSWVVWQANTYARVTGIRGDVDLDVLREGSGHSLCATVR